MRLACTDQKARALREAPLRTRQCLIDADWTSRAN